MSLSRLARSSITGVLAIVLSALLGVAPPALAQTVTPPGIDITSGPCCTGGSQDFPVSITLPPSTVTNTVDVFFLFDDTGSFAGFVPTVTSIFSGLVTSLETAMPDVSFAFGVGRFEDFGGPGTGFSGDFQTARPFTLNQPIVTAGTAGGAAARDTLIANALSRTAPGFGGDGPESALEALAQVATGTGFDGDGNGSSLDSGSAGDVATQTTPGNSGDVPPFSSNTAPVSGTQGGVGWRNGALRLVILATDICSVSAFAAGGPILGPITGAGTSSEPVTAFACTSVSPGTSRFGFASDAKTSTGNTVLGAVAPSDAALVQNTVSALNDLGIRVIGMGPSAAPTATPGPSTAPSPWLSAIARLTGAVDASGNPLVFSTSTTLGVLSTAIQNAITTAVTLPVDLTLTNTTLPSGLTMSFTPSVVNDVPPGGTANFTVTLTGSGSPITGAFTINFADYNSGSVLGSTPVTIACDGGGGGATCLRSRGWWRSHASAWPITTMTIGARSYSQAELLSILAQPVNGNGLVSLAHEVITAKLNAAAGAPLPASVADAIAAADAFYGSFVPPPIGTDTVKPAISKPYWQPLNTYNNGMTPGGPALCPK